MVVIGANISFISFKSITFFFVCVIINAFVVSYIWESSANREEGNKIHFTPNRFLLLCVACLEKKKEYSPNLFCEQSLLKNRIVEFVSFTYTIFFLIFARL